MKLLDGVVVGLAMRLRFALVALFAGSLNGCGGAPARPDPVCCQPSEIRVSDTAAIGSARVDIDVIRFSHGSGRMQTQHAMEIRLSGTSGDGDQNLAAGSEPVLFGDQRFDAPSHLSYRYSFRFGELSYRYSGRVRAGNASHFVVDALFGLGYARLDLAVSSETRQARETIDNTGLATGLGFAWWFSPTTSIELRGTTLYGLEEMDSVQRLEAHVAWTFARHARLRAGLEGWRVKLRGTESDQTVSSQSPITLRFAGPALGLDLMF